MFLPFIGPLISGITGFFKDKAKLKQAKVEGQIAITQQASKNIADWELLHAKGSQSSWKDEYVLIIFSIPTIMVFIPWLAPYATAGFETLHTLPEWYTYTFITIALASYGIKMKNIFWPK